MTWNRRLLHWGPVVLYAALTLALSSIPASRIERLPFTFWDKAAHFVEYGILSALVGRALRGASPWSDTKTPIPIAVLALILCVTWGAIDETYQGFTGRASDPLDLAADALGAGVVQAITAMRALGRENV